MANNDLIKLIKKANLFLKLAGIKAFDGEYWIINNDYIYADGDAGDSNHEIEAANYMIDESILIDYLVENSEENEEDISNYTGSELINNFNFPEEIGAESAHGIEKWQSILKDPRYAFEKYYGAIRCVSNSFETYKFTDKNLTEIKDFLFDVGNLMSVEPEQYNNIFIDFYEFESQRHAYVDAEKLINSTNILEIFAISDKK